MRTRILVAAALLLIGLPAAAEPLVGPAVGNADALQAEGNQRYNKKAYTAAAAAFLKVTRADPAALPAYLSLARAQLKAGRLSEACYAYRAYVRSAPDGDDRTKAQQELELCERQAKAKGKTADVARYFVEVKASFFTAMESMKLTGPDGAGAQLRRLVDEGYLGPDLADLAKRLHTAASQTAEDLHRRALAREKVAPEALREGRALYALAADVGPAPTEHEARGLFLEGMAELRSSQPAKAVTLLGNAAEADPSQVEYKFWRAVALHRSGDAAGALAALRKDMPDDPRTRVLSVIDAAKAAPDRAAAELETVLFRSRYPEGR